MTAIHAPHSPSDAKRSYPFLSRPPPQKPRPGLPLPEIPRCSPRRRSYSAIAAWAAHVQPGTPGTPHSLYCRTSTTFDLTRHGYTSVFLHVLQSPTTTIDMGSKPPVDPETFPKPSLRARSIKGFRSLGKLRSRSGSVIIPPMSPMKQKPSYCQIPEQLPLRSPCTPATTESPIIQAASVAKRNKAAYAYARSSEVPVDNADGASKVYHALLSPSLAGELALMQFTFGGSVEDNITRLMEERSQRVVSRDSPVSNAGIDVDGGTWTDCDDDFKSARLVEQQDSEDSKVVKSISPRIAKPVQSVTTETRPTPPPSLSLQIPPIPAPYHSPSSASPKTTPRTSPPLLSLPSRAHAKHYGNPAFFLLDLDAFSVPKTPRTSSSPKSPLSPRSPATPFPPTRHRPSLTPTVFPSGSATRKTRRRPVPAPLMIVPPPQSARTVERNGDNLILVDVPVVKKTTAVGKVSLDDISAEKERTTALVPPLLPEKHSKLGLFFKHK